VDLVREADGRVAGVQVVDADGKRAEVRARATLLASGGYEGNPEMMTHYMGTRAAHIRPVARGGYYNKGEGIRMALAAGAAPAGDFGSYHAEPVDPRSRQPEAVVHIYPYGILVNKRGERFVNEGPGMVDAWYDPITRTVADQPDGICWVIFDAKVEEIPRWKTSIRSDVPPRTTGSGSDGRSGAQVRRNAHHEPRRDLGFGKFGPRLELSVGADQFHSVVNAAKGSLFPGNVIGDDPITTFGCQLATRVALEILGLGGEPDHQQTARPAERAQRRFRCIAADRIVDHVGAAPVSQLAHCRAQVLDVHADVVLRRELRVRVPEPPLNGRERHAGIHPATAGFPSQIVEMQVDGVERRA